MKTYRSNYLLSPFVAAVLIVVLVAIYPSKSGYENLLVFFLPVIFPAIFLACLLQYFFSVVPAIRLVSRCDGWKSHAMMLTLSTAFGFLVGFIVMGWMVSKEQLYVAGVQGAAISFVEGMVVVVCSAICPDPVEANQLNP